MNDDDDDGDDDDGERRCWDFDLLIIYYALRYYEFIPLLS